MKKSVCDAWNGFHSVVVRPEDRKYLIFMTKWGRYRYRSAPQGWLASGDAYTHRFDKIISNFPHDVIKQIDDSLLYSSTITGAVNAMSQYVHLLSTNGIVLNPNKLQLAQDTVHFSGFEVTTNSVRPLPIHIESIRSFPQPKSSTDI